MRNALFFHVCCPVRQTAPPMWLHLSKAADLCSGVKQSQIASQSFYEDRVSVLRQRTCLSLHDCQKMRQWWKFPIPLCDRQDNWLSVTFTPREKQVLFRLVGFMKCCVASAEEDAKPVELWRTMRLDEFYWNLT